MKLARLLFFLALPAVTWAQGVRIGDNYPVQSSSLAIPGTISTVAGSQVNVCAFPANGVPCTNKATTFTDQTLATSCPLSTQIVLTGTTSCVGNTDSRGNWGAWVAAGSYSFTITTSSGQSYGPWWITVSSAGGVSTFNGRSGVVVPTTGDYNFPQISGVAQPGQGGTGSANPAANGVAIAQGPTLPYLFALASNAAQCFMSDPTNYIVNPPSFQTCPSGGGGGSPSQGSQGTVNAAGASAGTFGPTNIWDINGAGGTYFHGLNPYIDVTHPTFGGYIGPNYNAPATTCTMAASSTSASCASASDFLKGQGILVPHAGPAPVIATPQAPTVTPLFQVGSTTRSYCVADRDWFGGLTPCSPIGSTSTAPSSMALQSYSISSWSWNSSTNTMTITTSANHNMPTTASGIVSEPYAQVEIQAGTSSSGLCEGAFSLTAVPSGTQLQFQRNELTSNPNCSGGTLRIAPEIMLKWDSHYTYSVTAASCSAGQATILVSPVPLGPNGTWVIPNGVKAITSGISDSHYNGTVQVAPATGAFTFNLNCSGVTNVGAGGTLSLVPGKAVKNHLVYACNGGSCALPTNAANYSLVGVEQGNDGYFIDRGWAISASSVDLGDAPSTAPTAAINEWLDTTITAGGGTTSLTLASPSTNAVTSVGVWHDNVPNILAACASLPASSSASDGGHIIVPATGSLYQFFPIIANLDLAGNFGQAPKNCPGNTSIDFGSNPWLDGSILLGKGNALTGAAVGGGTNCQSTFYQMGAALTCLQGSSYPMIYFEPEQASSNFLKDLVANPQQAYQSGLFIDEQMNGDGTVSVRTDNFHVNGGIHTYPFVGRAGFGWFFNFGGFANGGGNFSESIDATFQPLCGMPNYYPFTAPSLPYILRTDHTYSFGTMKIDSCGQASGNFGNTTVFNDLTTESNAGPAIKANLYPYGIAQLTIDYANNADLTGGSSTPYFDVTNATIGSAAFNFIGCGTATQPLFETNSANPYSGIHLTMGLGCNGGIGYPPLAGVVYENLYRNQWKWNGMQFAMTNGGRLTAGQIATPAVAPTVTVTTSCTGFPPAGTYTYGVVAWDATSNPTTGTGGATTVGPASTSVTLNGTTQCVSIAQPTLPTGTAYWGTARLSGPGSVDQVFISGVSSINAFVPVTTTTIVDQTAFTAGSVPSINTTGLQSISAGNMTGNFQPLSFLPLTDNTVDIGSALLRFRNAFFGGTLIAGGNVTFPGLLTTGTITNSLCLDASGHLIANAGGNCYAAGSSTWAALTAGANSNAGTFSASGNSWDFTAATIFKLRSSGGLTTSANGDFGYDSANGNWHGWNGGDSIFVPLASGFSSGHCGQPTLAGGKWTVVDVGAACSTGVGLPAGGLIGQVLGNSAPGSGTWSSPALPPSSTSPVSTASYAVRCDSGTALQDRSTEVHFTSGASTPTLPLSSGTGCFGLFTRLVDDSAGSLVFGRTSTDTFVVYTPGSAPSTGQTSFTLVNGQYANVHQNTAYNGTDKWEVYLSPITVGTVTSVTIAGTTNQIAVSGTCTITTTGTCTIAFPSTIVLPNGSTGTTQTAGSNDMKVSTDAYVDAHFIANGTAAMGTSAISSGSCASVVTVSATGVATTDVITVGFNGDPTAVTGYGASGTSAVLSIYAYPTANNVNFKVCNSTGSSITPGSLTLNWKVTR